MHPDEAVQLALQDLRTRAPNSTPPHVEARHRGMDLLRAYFSPLRWYVTPAMDEALLPLAMGACP